MKSLYTVNFVIVGLVALFLYMAGTKPQERNFSQASTLPVIDDVVLDDVVEGEQVFLDNGYELLALKEMNEEDLSLAFPQVVSSLRYHLDADSEGTLSWAKSLPDDVRGSVLEILIKAWASQEPVAVSDWVEKNLSLNEKSIKPCLLLVEEWAQKTPVITAEWVQNLENEKLKKACREVLIDAWAQSAPESLESWLSSVRDEESIKKALGAIIHFRVEAGLEEAFTWALQSELLTVDTRLTFMKRALKKSFKESHSFLKKNPSFINTVDVPTLFTELSQEKAEALIKVYSSLADTDFFYKELIIQSANENFSRALLLLPKVENEALQQEILTDLALIEVRSNPDLAVKVFDKVPIAEMKKLKEFSLAWSETAPDKLLQWLFSWDMKTFFGEDKFEDIPVNEQNAFVYAAISGEDSEVAFLTDLERITYEARAKSISEDLLSSIETAAKDWAKQDYLASQVFLLSLKKGALKDAFLAGIIEASAAKNALSLFSLLDSCSTEEVYKDFYIRCCLKLAYLNGYEAIRRLKAQAVTDLAVYLDLVDAWSFNRPLKALAYAEKNFDELFKAQAYSLVYKNFYRRWPNKALSEFSKIVNKSYRHRALKAFYAVNVHYHKKFTPEHLELLNKGDKEYLKNLKQKKQKLGALSSK